MNKLLNANLIDTINMSTYGAKMPRANSEFIMNCYIAYPTYNEQKIISDFLDTKCKEIDATIKTGFLYHQPMEQIIEYAKTLRVDAIHPHLKLVTKDLIEKAHQNQLDVNVYTVNSPIHMRELIRAEVDGIFTDYPSLLNEIIEENKLKSLV